MPCVCELKIIMRSNAIFWIFSKLWPRTFETQAVVLRLDASLNCCRRKHFNTAVFPFCVGFTCVRFWSLEAACLHTAQCMYTTHIYYTLYTKPITNMHCAHRSTKYASTVIPAMVQRLFVDIIKQRDHEYATHSPENQFYVFLAIAPTGVFTLYLLHFPVGLCNSR